MTSSPNRREFIFLSLCLGLCTFSSARTLAKSLKALDIHSDYRGPLISKTGSLIARLDRKEISAEIFVNELSKYYDEMDLTKELSPWLESSHGENEMKDIFTRENRDHNEVMSLFFIAGNSSHPPHAHHDLMSTQCVLRGKVHVRQYNRIDRLDKKHLTIRLTNEAVLDRSGKILMTENKDNVHWFGAVDEPAVILNYNISGTYQKTFDPLGSRHKKRYHVDPMTGEHSNGMIIAREMTKDEAYEKYSSRPLSEFKII